ncbi:MAG TPA: DUF2283 domain-containing protein [Gaiellaceae bacterium]
MSVTIADIEFDHVSYFAEGDVLYLHIGDPHDAVDWDESPEGDGLRFGRNGGLIGLTILNAKLRLAEDGEIAITLPDKRLVATDLGDAFAHA